jgi:hypothetical protein
VKKLAAGCLVVLVLCAVAAGIGAVLVFRSARPLVERAGQTMDALANVGRARELEAGVTSTASFAPPASGEITEAQLQRFLGVQRKVYTRLGAGVEALKAKYAEVRRPGVHAVDYGQLLAAFGEVSDVYLDGKRAQVEALNAAGFSVAEYRWVRLRVYAAAGVEVTDVRLEDLERLLKQSGARVDAPATADLGAVPAPNRALVKPHLAEIEEWVPLAFIGL